MNNPNAWHMDIWKHFENIIQKSFYWTYIGAFLLLFGLYYRCTVSLTLLIFFLFACCTTLLCELKIYIIAFIIETLSNNLKIILLKDI